MAKTTARARPKRNPDAYVRMLRAIHAACRKNGLDDDARRALMAAITGKASLTHCTPEDMHKILDHLNRANGYAGKSAYAGRARVTPVAARAPLLAKIDALLAELHRVTGEVHTLKYVDAIAKKNGWAECIDFCDAAGLRKLVGALARTLAAKAMRAA
jgi:hypothetical protein